MSRPHGYHNARQLASNIRAVRKPKGPLWPAVVAIGIAIIFTSAMIAYALQSQ